MAPVVKNQPTKAGDSKRCVFNPRSGKILWNRKWQPAPTLLPGKSHGQRSLAGYNPWGHKEADTTERLSKHMSPYIKYLCVGVYTYTWYMMSQMVTAAMKLKDTCSLEEKL